ncbi:MAG: protein phosphatase 2C domain-containing protein, partial [Anaerolineae bacterium]|nr:protein phosphatase 2C domain-containing protein [Anaerolineae bacterium]
EPDNLTQKGRLYLIADAVAGTASAQTASRYAIQKVLHSFYTSTSKDLQDQLLTAIKQSNKDVFEKNNQHPERRIMATTLMAALIQDDKLLVANVGDNRAYVVWDKDIELLNQEVAPVSVAAKPEKKAEEKKAEDDTQTQPTQPPAKTEDSPKSEAAPKKADIGTPRERLPQALGFDPEVEVQFFSRKLFPGDIVILVSGGLAGYIEPKEMAKAATDNTPEEASKQIIALARERGSRDQIAISITKILPETVQNHTQVPMPLPTAPNWNDVAAPAKPRNGTGPLPVITTKPATSTQPLPDPTKHSTATGKLPSPTPSPAAERRFGDPQLTKSFAEVFAKDKNRSRFYLIALVWVLLLCSSLFIVWRYVIPPETLASVPVLGSIDTLIRGDEADQEAVDGGDNLAASGSLLQQDAEAVASPQRTLPAAASDFVTEGDSPVATPRNTFFNSPLSTPTVSGSSADTLARSSAAETLNPTPIPLPTIVLPANCENRARFYRDVTVPDGTQFAAGEEFEKTWLITNVESCPWGPGYTVRFLDGDAMGANRSIPLTEQIAPETNGEISVSMVAPSKPGSYRGVWQLHDLTGEPFGPEMYLEIEVLPAGPATIDESSSDVLYDFIANANKATWSAGNTTYTPVDSRITEELEIPAPQGLVATGTGLLRGNQESNGNVLLTYPDADLGFIEGKYVVDTPLQPTDTLVANLGFPKLSILSDDGVIFEVVFTPDDGSEGVQILSTNVQYQDSPVADVVPLSGIKAGQTGTFTVRVLSGDSLSRDYATWIDLRLIRP